MDEILNEIVATMGDHECPSTIPIPREKVLRWMQSDDIEVLGAVYALMADKRHYPRINPPLSLSDSHSFAMRYYERCFLEDPDGQWSSSRYQAGRDLVNWFTGLWDDRTVARETLHELKNWLARLYKGGDEALRTCLVTATLEHLFERREIAKYFEDWKKDPLLEQAYNDALLWSEKGGSSPLGKQERE